MVQAAPILPALDVAAAAAWYRDRLGFSVVMEAADYAIVVRDRIELHFWRCDDRLIAESTSAYVRVEDIDDLQRALAKAADGGRISDVQSQDWGMREFYIWDPSGNLLRFGQPVGSGKDSQP